MASENGVTSEFEQFDFDLCSACIMAYANDDFTGTDYSYGAAEAAEAAERVETIKAGLDREFGVEGFVGLNSKHEDGFFGDCECCRVKRTKVYSWVATYRVQT